MPKPSRHILSLSLLLCYLAAAAQADEDVMDTAITVVEAPVATVQDTVTFDIIRSRAAVATRRVPQKKLDSLKAAGDFWYANVERKKKKAETPKDEKEDRSLLQQQWFRDVMWVIVLCSFIGVVLWYLVSSNILIFRRGPKQVTGDEGAVEDSDDIFSLQYDREISKAETENNYRLAVRLRYLQTLKQLSERGQIDYRLGRTNSDYVLQLQNRPFYRDFFRLTRNFEYTWYGQFDLSAEAYGMMQRDFIHFQKGLPG